MPFDSINPATDERVASFPETSPTELETALERATRAALNWGRRSPRERGALLRAVAAVLRADLERYAKMITIEVGKPIGEARAEIEKCALACDYYAETANACWKMRMSTSRRRA